MFKIVELHDYEDSEISRMTMPPTRGTEVIHVEIRDNGTVALAVCDREHDKPWRMHERARGALGAVVLEHLAALAIKHVKPDSIEIVETHDYEDGDVIVRAETSANSCTWFGFGTRNDDGSLQEHARRIALSHSLLEQFAALARNYATPETQAQLAKLDGSVGL